MKLSIIVPTYNSEERVVTLLKKLKTVKIPLVKKEIIVVDDCSTNKTYSLLKKQTGIILIRHTKNTGKGGAIRTGLAKASGDIFFLQDDDLEYDPNDIPKIILPMQKKQAQVVFGSRRMNKDNEYSSKVYYFGGVFLDILFSFVLRHKITDGLTGSKAFTKTVLNKIAPIEANGFDIEAEIAAKCIRQGFKIAEVPITYNPRSHKEGKNIRWHHGFQVVKTLIRFAIL